MDISIAEVIAQAVAFVTVFTILRWKAWGPIQASLQARRDKIKSEFDSIESSKQEMDKLKADYMARLDKIEEEARTKLQEAINEGSRIAGEIQDKARQEAQATFDKNKETLGLEVKKARITLRREIADLAVDVAERVVKDKFADDKTQQDKIVALIEEIEKA